MYRNPLQEGPKLQYEFPYSKHFQYLEVRSAHTLTFWLGKLQTVYIAGHYLIQTSKLSSKYQARLR